MIRYETLKANVLVALHSTVNVKWNGDSLVGNHEYLPVMNTYLVKLTSIFYQKLLIGVNQSFFQLLDYALKCVSGMHKSVCKYCNHICVN